MKLQENMEFGHDSGKHGIHSSINDSVFAKIVYGYKKVKHTLKILQTILKLSTHSFDWVLNTLLLKIRFAANLFNISHLFAKTSCKPHVILAEFGLHVTMYDEMQILSEIERC